VKRETLDQALDHELYRAARDAAADGSARLVEVPFEVGPAPDARLAAAIAHLGIEHKPEPDWQHGVWRRIDAAAWTRVLEHLVGEELTDAVVSAGHGDVVSDEAVMRIAKRTARGVVRALGIGDV
jgi:hypothetical protein